MSKTKVIASNGYWDLVIDTVDDNGVHIGTGYTGGAPHGLYLDSEQIDKVVLALLKAQRKFVKKYGC